MLTIRKELSRNLPEYTFVEALCRTICSFETFRPMFYDIETTGLSRTSTYVYLIGAVVHESSWTLYQWLAQDAGEERSVLEAFRRFSADCLCTVQYNGDRFDAPYLRQRYELYGMESPLDMLPALDLYQCLKPLRSLLGLIHMRQPDLEAFLSMDDRAYCDGGQCIRLYHTYRRDGNPSALEILFGHNHEDLENLIRLTPMLAYLCLFRGRYEPVRAELRDGILTLAVSLPFTLPRALSGSADGFRLRMEDRTAAVQIEAPDGRLRRYYSNYRDYDYLPGEDTAIPKSLSAYMDKRLKKPARPETCYTWFLCTEQFLRDGALQKKYLDSTLSVMLPHIRAESADL